MEYIPWFVWIILAAIVFGTTAQVVDTVLKHRRKVAELTHGPARHEVLTRLEAIERRLDGIERTLTEIPG